MQFRLLLLAFLAVFFMLFEDSYQLQSESNNFHFLLTKNKRQRHGKIKTVRVYDDMACIQQCSRIADTCIAVNFKKDSMINGLHDCELLEIEGNIEDDMAFEDNDGFDNIVLQKPSFENCAEIKKKTQPPSVGVFVISPTVDLPHIKVWCDMVTTGGGWTVIQRRLTGKVDFYRGWADYKNGFGDLEGEYWLGLDAIHSMTSQGGYRLRVDLEDFAKNKRYAEYDTFIVAGEADNYRLTVGQYSGNAGDSLALHNSMQFTTKDRDNDNQETNCANQYHGAWWYNSCHESNLNGLYYSEGSSKASAQGIIWLHWLGHGYSLKKVAMKIRPKDF